MALTCFKKKKVVWLEKWIWRDEFEWIVYGQKSSLD